MAAKVSYKDDTLTITADESSSVRNVRVRGKKVYIGREVGWGVVLARFAFYLACALFCMGVWGAVFWAFERLAFGQSTGGQCELIKNVDQRHYCRACWQQGKQGECELIKDRDLRYQCRAQCKARPK